APPAVQIHQATLWLDEATALVGGWSRGIAGDQAYNFYMANFGTHADGDTITQPFDLAEGTYHFHVLGIASANRAILDWYVDDALVLAGQDWDAASQIFNTVLSGAVTLAPSGLHVLQAIVHGHNGSSTDFYFTLTKCWFEVVIP